MLREAEGRPEGSALTSVVDLAELWSGQQTLPRHPDGDPDVDAAGRLLAALWLGGFDAFGAAITPLPSGAIHAALVPDALAVIVDGAPGATFVARLESRLGGFGATAALLAALGQWLEGAQEIVDGAATVVPRASGRHTAPANVRDTAAGSRLHADPASEQPADSGARGTPAPGAAS